MVGKCLLLFGLQLNKHMFFSSRHAYVPKESDPDGATTQTRFGDNHSDLS